MVTLGDGTNSLFHAGGTALVVHAGPDDYKTDPAGKGPPTCWVIIDVKGGKFTRNPATPSGFRCDPGGYYG